MKLRSANAGWKRLVVCLFMAIASGGVTFYLFMFAGLMAALFTSGMNPVQTPGLNAALRIIAAPVSLSVSVVVFVFAIRHRSSAKIAASEARRAAS